MSFKDLRQKLHASIVEVKRTIDELPSVVKFQRNDVQECYTLLDTEDWEGLLKLLGQHVNALEENHPKTREEAEALRRGLFALLDFVDEVIKVIEEHGGGMMDVRVESRDIEIKTIRHHKIGEAFTLTIGLDTKRIGAEVVMSGLIHGVLIEDEIGQCAYIEIHGIPGYALGVNTNPWTVEVVGVPPRGEDLGELIPLLGLNGEPLS